MRLMVAAFLMGSLFCAPAVAAEKPVVPQAATDKSTSAKPDAAKPDTVKPDTVKPTTAKPARVLANKPIDYDDMRCAFAVRHRDALDSQIIAWAGGFIEGYVKANPERLGSNRTLSELTDPAVLRTHIRGYCLKHREKSIGAAVLAMVSHPTHGTETPSAPTPKAQPK
jgi:hypothetical protein